MSPDSRLPAIAGVAQKVQRVDDPVTAAEPVELMEQALRAAAEDAGAPKLLESVDAVLVPQGMWKYGDPGRLLAERVGARSPRTGLGAISGHTVQMLVDWACTEIAADRHDVVAIVGAESENSKRRLVRQGRARPWNDETPGEPDVRIGNAHIDVLKHEAGSGIFKPSVTFALCDTSLRRARGEHPAQHRDRISALWARMSAVAATNPNAWLQRAVPADEIRNPGPGNRMVTYPYTKLMTANIAVDQGAALIVCSDEAARRFGVAPDRLVYLRAATEMHHGVPLSARQQLHQHPGLDAAGQRVLELVGAGADDLRHVDLYSCFPFAVQAAAAALGLDEERPLTVTGGLTFAGGPFANYVIQAKARMVERLRADPGTLGLVGSVGGVFAKFAFGVYSTDPGDARAPVVEDVSAAYASLPTRAWRADYQGTAEIESYAVDTTADGAPDAAIFSALTVDGERVWGRSADAAVMQALLADEDACGRRARANDGRIELL